MAEPRKQDILKTPVVAIDIKQHDVRPLVDAMADMAFQARNLARASRIYDKMLADQDCSVIVCLAGSLCSAGLRDVFVDLIEHGMADALVSTGANIVDQDFFEALGFRHWKGDVRADDDLLRRLAIDRIYDTYIDEEQLQYCDKTVTAIADALPPRPYSSREFIREMGRYLTKKAKKKGSLVQVAYENDVPIFCPAFSDSSAGFGLVLHQHKRPKNHLTIDSVKDFRELTEIKIAAPTSGLLMIGGGVPKNFIQDTVICAEILGKDVPMHQYAIQITVADARDGACSSSTLKEAASWGKVDTVSEQMVFAEATMALPLLASYAYHEGSWKKRKKWRFGRIYKD